MVYYKDSLGKLIQGDVFEIFKSIPDDCIDFIWTDPPYFLSTENGISCQAGKMVSVKKGDWDK